jgi:hypothetical protein
LYRGNSDLKKGYQPRTNIVMGEMGGLVADSHSILARWRNHFSQLLDIHGVNVVRQTKLHTAQTLVPKTIFFEAEWAIEKLKRHKTSRFDQIELIKAGGYNSSL